MRITVRQLKRLIREAVEDASGERLYDPALGLEDVTNSREKQNGTVALLDPQTGDKYKITVPSRYVRLYKAEWEIMSTGSNAAKSRYSEQGSQRPILIVNPKDVLDDIEFIEVAYTKISQYVNKRRASLPTRKKDADNLSAQTNRFYANHRDLTPEEQELEMSSFKGTSYKTPEFEQHVDRHNNYWKNKPRRN